MKKVTRFDKGKIEVVNLDKAQRTPEGYLIAPVRAARTGVLTYYDAYGTPFKEFVPEEELFKADSMASLAMKPVTVRNHPSVMLDSKNWKKFQVGMTSDKVEKDGEFLATTAIVQDADAIKDVDGGMQEISCGYVAELEMTPGEYKGEKYDAIQRNRHYNHIAIVDKGRAGREARMRLDSEFNITEEENIMKFKIGDKEFDVSQEVADYIGSQSQTIANLTTGKADSDAKLALLKADAEKVPALIAEAEKQKGRADAAEVELAKLKDPKKFNDAVNERIQLIVSAKPMLDAEIVKKLDSMSDVEIMSAAILSQDKEAKLDGKPEAYILGRFEALSKTEKKDDGGLGAGIVGARKDASNTGEEDKDNKQILKDKWKTPIQAE